MLLALAPVWPQTTLAQPAAPQATPAQTTSAQATPTRLRAGWQTFVGRSCASCHAIRGTPANGRVGPDLTHFAGRLTIAAGVLPNTPANLARWLKHPQEVKPGCGMPDLYLSDAEVARLVTYLEALK